MRPFQIGGDQLVEAFRRCLQYVAPFARRHARIVDQQVEALRTLARKFDQRGTVRADDMSHRTMSAPVSAARFSAAARLLL